MTEDRIKILLKSLRKDSGLTHIEVAEKFKKCRQWYSDVENGRLSTFKLDKLWKLFEIFGYDAEIHLVSRKDKGNRRIFKVKE